MNNHFNFELTQFPKEMKLLLSLLKTERKEEILFWNEDWFQNFDWKLFLDLAVHHRVFPILYQKVKSLENEHIPSFVIQFLQKEYQKNVFRMLQLTGEMEVVAKLFGFHQIRTIFLKGPNLAADLYDNLSLRTSADLDVLIPIENLQKAEELLLNQGYTKDEYIQTVLNDWKWRHHHFTFFHPVKQIKVELHWRFNPGPAWEPKFNELWNRRRRSSFSKYPIYILGLEDLFLFLVTHGARHGWSRLRWLMDIRELIKKNIDWNKTIQLLKKNHYLQIGGQALILVSQLLNAEVPNEMKKLIIEIQTRRLAYDALFYIKQMVNLHHYPLPEKVAQYHKRHLITLMSKTQKTFFALSLLFPYPEDVKVIPLPKYLHFLYIPLRPIILILKKTRKRAVTRRV
ncbi:MAG: nucleotidyltransferase family protein [Bacillota bacterium]|nr:nucleotidyltransferase family protein [Bacillota bacterium]